MLGVVKYLEECDILLLCIASPPNKNQYLNDMYAGGKPNFSNMFHCNKFSHSMSAQLLAYYVHSPAAHRGAHNPQCQFSYSMLELIYLK